MIKKYKIIHVHDIPEVGHYLKIFGAKRILLHYSRESVMNEPLHKRQKKEQHFDKIVVNEKECEGMGFHSTPECIETSKFKGTPIQILSRIYNEMWFG